MQHPILIKVHHIIVAIPFEELHQFKQNYIMTLIARSNSRHNILGSMYCSSVQTNPGCKRFLIFIVPCVLCIIALGIIVYEIAWMYYLPGILMTHDTEELTITTQQDGTNTILQTKKTVTRRRPDLLYKNVQGQKVPNTHIDGIMEGLLTLIDIQIPATADLLPTIAKDELSEQMYSGIIATFCHVSWELQNDDKHSSKASLSTFTDLQQSSVLCPGTKVDVDLWDVVQQLRQYDDIQRNATKSMRRKATVNVVSKPTAVIFHESKSGSTVISNALSAFAVPHHTRVYVEASPPSAALHACELHTATHRRCTKESHIALIQDVFYVMGRVSRTINPGQPQYIFHKLHSSGVQSIDAFVSAMPSTPWIFAYRNSVEILMSHFPQYMRSSDSTAQYSLLSSSHDDPECLLNYGKPESEQPPLVVELVGLVEKQMSQLSKEEYCAAHIAGLATAAIREHDRTVKLAVSTNAHAVEPIRASEGERPTENHHYVAAPPHFFINYNTLPHSIWEKILPSLVVHHSIDDKYIEDMRTAASYKITRNKGSKPTKVDNEHWMEDNTIKHGMAPQSIQTAARLFLKPVYDAMESIRLKSDHTQ